jgi:hypothetical protein
MKIVCSCSHTSKDEIGNYGLTVVKIEQFLLRQIFEGNGNGRASISDVISAAPMGLIVGDHLEVYALSADRVQWFPQNKKLTRSNDENLDNGPTFELIKTLRFNSILTEKVGYRF